MSGHAEAIPETQEMDYEASRDRHSPDENRVRRWID